jgi:hypothetical protein
MTTDNIILIAVTVFAVFCFWRWLIWKAEAKFYTMMWKSEQENNVNLFNLNKKLAEKARHDGPKVLAEDPVPYGKELQARIEKSAGMVPEKAVDEHSFGGKAAESNAQIAWTRQDRYRLKMERNGFVRVIDERGRTRYMKVEKTAWIKSTKQWVRVSRDSKLFKEASFFFPGNYEKPTKNNYWQLLNRVHQDIEKGDGSEA